MNNQLCGQFLEEKNIGNRTNLSVASPGIDQHVTLQTIADNCLYEIFSFLLSDMTDLCVVAETCKRFQSLAQRLIRKNFCFYMLYEPCATQYKFKWGKCNYSSNKQIDVERIFKSFGSCLSEVTVFIYGQQEGFVLNLVNRHCRDELKTLSINILSNAVEAVELNPVFKRLRNLRFQFVFIVEGTTLFRNFDSLIDLYVDFVRNCSTILESQFPHLENFSYCKNKVLTANEMSQEHDQQSLERILTFIQRHSSLKKLSLRFFSDKSCWTAIVETIASNCTTLQELRMNINNKCYLFSSLPLKSLQALTTLKTVELKNTSIDDFEMFRYLINLRELVLVDCYLPKDIDQFAFVIQIRKFRLVMYKNHGGAMPEIDAVGIIRWLTNLNEFAVFSVGKEFVLNEAKFVQIADLVRNRSNVLTLKCKSTVTNSARNLIVVKF